MSRISFINYLPLVLCVAVLAGCGGSDPAPEPIVDTPISTPSASDVRVVEVDLGSAITPDRTVVEETDDFRPSDTIYASVFTQGTGTNVTLTAQWLYEDGQVVDETSQNISPSGPMYTEFHISMADGLPIGDYSVNILLNGDRVESEDFEVL